MSDIMQHTCYSGKIFINDMPTRIIEENESSEKIENEMAKMANIERI